jgi:hypothetical protein
MHAMPGASWAAPCWALRRDAGYMSAECRNSCKLLMYLRCCVLCCAVLCCAVMRLLCCAVLCRSEAQS